MRWGALIVLGLGLMACAPSDPQVVAERLWTSCETNAFPQQRILDCSALIAASETPQERRVQAYINRGAERAAQNEYARAIADFGRALRLDPRNADAHLERGLVHHNRGAYDSAVASYDAALALQPNMQTALERRAAALGERLEGWRRELAQLDQMLAVDPRNPDLLNNRCWVRAVNGDELDRALADCNEAVRIAPSYGAALDSRGLVHLKRGAYAEALADYEAALSIEPNTGHYLYGRGLARIALGQKDAGEADLRAAEAADPGIAAQYSSYGLDI